MSATIEPIRDHGKSWGAQAAAADALNRVPNDAPFIAIWLDKDAKGEDLVKWSKANLDFRQYAYMAVVLSEFAQACVRDAMNRYDGPPAA